MLNLNAAFCLVKGLYTAVEYHPRFYQSLFYLVASWSKNQLVSLSLQPKSTTRRRQGNAPESAEIVGVGGGGGGGVEVPIVNKKKILLLYSF